jgi:hypothetical protein
MDDLNPQMATPLGETGGRTFCTRCESGQLGRPVAFFIGGKQLLDTPPSLLVRDPTFEAKTRMHGLPFLMQAE